jgi:hypothetical protein
LGIIKEFCLEYLVYVLEDGSLPEEMLTHLEYFLYDLPEHQHELIYSPVVNLLPLSSQYV